MRLNSGKAITVYVYNKDKILLKKYFSIMECSKQTGISALRIRSSMISFKLVDNKYYFSKTLL